jgi:hypothetical protein
MSAELNERLAAILHEPGTVKLLITTDDQGAPHAVVKDSLNLDENHHFFYLERLESSQTNKNMVYSIWYDRSIAINVTGTSGESFQIKGKPIKAIVSGYTFRKYYKQLREEDDDNDLAAVWVIEPEQIIEQTFLVRRRQEEKRRPYFKHLDRLAKSK